jgi:hypothetical protein
VGGHKDRVVSSHFSVPPFDEETAPQKVKAAQDEIDESERRIC